MESRATRLITLSLLQGLVLLGPGAAGAADLVYSGSDFAAVYRFVPVTGTLNDLQVIYQDGFQFHPSNFGGITTFVLAGEELHPWEGRHASRLVEESFDGGIYRAMFEWSYLGDSLEFGLTARMEGKTLVIDFTSDSGKVVDFSLDRSEETPVPRIVDVPYGHPVLYTSGVFVSGVIEIAGSGASSIVPSNAVYSDTSVYYAGGARYEALTDGTRNNLVERVRLTVSPSIEDVFYRPPNPVSAYRDLLTDKVVIDLWGDFAYYRSDLQAMASLGMTDLFALLHVWQRYGYDNGLPTSYPAGDGYGGEAALLEVVALCEAEGYLFALHTNYVDFYQNADVWNPADVALDPGGEWIEAWFNESTGIQSYLMKPTRARSYAELYEPSIHTAYRTSAAYLDVHTAILPSYKVDFDAGAAGAGKQVTTFETYLDLLGYVRTTHAGPLAGEGFGSPASVWAGHVDAIEADPRSTFQSGRGLGGTDVPTLVDYKLRVLHGLFVPHGAGYLERFFNGKWNDYTTQELDRYRATEIAFGNAGFIQSPGNKGIAMEVVAKDYCFVKHLQQRYLSAEPTEIVYRVGDAFVPVSDALRSILPGTTPENVDEVLLEQLGIVRVTYSDGLRLYVNRSASRTLDVLEGGVAATLPPGGFLGVLGGEFLAYHAEVGGTLTDYICPAEDLCSTCPPGWEPEDLEPVPEEESGDETSETVPEPVPDADASLDPVYDDGGISEVEGEGPEGGGSGCSCGMAT